MVVVPVNINLFNIKSYMGTVLVVLPVNISGGAPSEH